MQDKKKILEAQIELLEDLFSEYVNPGPGDRDNLQKKTYVLFNKVIRFLNEKRLELRELEIKELEK